jgi:hypothetical protein
MYNLLAVHKLALVTLNMRMNDRGSIVILMLGLSVLEQCKSDRSRTARTTTLAWRKQTDNEQS